MRGVNNMKQSKRSGTDKEHVTLKRMSTFNKCKAETFWTYQDPPPPIQTIPVSVHQSWIACTSPDPVDCRRRRRRRVGKLPQGHRVALTVSRLECIKTISGSKPRVALAFCHQLWVTVPFLMFFFFFFLRYSSTANIWDTVYSLTKKMISCPNRRSATVCLRCWITWLVWIKGVLSKHTWFCIFFFKSHWLVFL